MDHNICGSPTFSDDKVFIPSKLSESSVALRQTGMLSLTVLKPIFPEKGRISCCNWVFCILLPLSVELMTYQLELSSIRIAHHHP